MRALFDAYAMWIPLGLCLSILGCGIMLGWMARGEVMSHDAQVSDR